VPIYQRANDSTSSCSSGLRVAKMDWPDDEPLDVVPFRRRRIGQTLLNPAIPALVHDDGDDDPVEQTAAR